MKDAVYITGAYGLGDIVNQTSGSEPQVSDLQQPEGERRAHGKHVPALELRRVTPGKTGSEEGCREEDRRERRDVVLPGDPGEPDCDADSQHQPQRSPGSPRRVSQELIAD